MTKNVVTHTRACARMHEKGKYIHRKNNRNCIVHGYETLHFGNCEKLTCAIECLNHGNDEKSLLASSEFH